MADADISAYVVPTTPSEAAPTAYTPAAVPQNKSSKRSSAFLTAILIFLLIVIVWMLIRPHNLAARLARKGWVLYVRPGCGYCTKQQQVLGTDHYRLKVVCLGGQRGAAAAIEPASLSDTEAPVLCSKVSAFPFWINRRTGETRTGLQNHAALEKMV